MADITTSADYIVVGGGTAGLVVANRLTEDPNVHVLVLEAGQNHLTHPIVNITTFFTALVGSEADFHQQPTPRASLSSREHAIRLLSLPTNQAALNGSGAWKDLRASDDAAKRSRVEDLSYTFEGLSGELLLT